MTRAPRSLTFSVNVDSAPGTCRLPSRYTPISMGMRRSVRWKGKALVRGEFMVRSSSQARRDTREILDTAATMLHAVKSAVGGSQQLFGRVAVFWKRRRAGACGKCRRFRFASHFFVDAADDAAGDVRPRFREDDGEFVAAVTRRCVNGAAVIAENLSQAHQRPAAREVPVAVVDLFEAVHVEKDHAEGSLRAARTIEFRFDDAQQTAIVGKAGERVADGERPHLIKEPGLIEQRAEEHDQVAGGFCQFSQKKR